MLDMIFGPFDLDEDAAVDEPPGDRARIFKSSEGFTAR